MRALGVVVAVSAGLALTVAAGAPAAADPARPTNDRSVVVAVDPSAPVAVSIVGGDAFLRLAVEAGHVVEVPGYEGEPYLRIEADGRVRENQRSPARWLNTDRYGPTEAPPAVADASADPEWITVGEGGRHVWHDHRVHDMGGGDPPAATWIVPLRVDGRVVIVRGTLTRQPAPAALPWFVLAVAVAGTLLVAARPLRPGRRRTAVVPAVVVGAAIGALVVGIALVRALPGDAGPGWASVALPLLALVAATLALVGIPAWLAGPATAGAGVALLLWSARRVSVFDHAVLLTSLPSWVDRAVVAVGLGVGTMAIVHGVVAVRAGPGVPAPRRPAAPAA